MSHDESDNLAYNPFAEEYDGSSELTPAQGYYSSAFFLPPSPTQQTLRRRGSSLTEGTRLKDTEDRKKHLRSRTEIQIVPHSAGLHPLKSALAANGAIFGDVGITRPHLSRIVNERALVDFPSTDTDVAANKTPPSSDEEKDVIVHHVTSKDSLAGVSLKYGISLGALRRANRLWTSDSIHRRELLYIPVDQASRANEYIPEPALMTFTPDEQDDVASVFSSISTSVSSTSQENSVLVPPSSVRRISTKLLSYFPPSTNKTLLSNFKDYPHTNSPYLQPPSDTLGSSRYPTSSANNSFTSILTVLPIAASTRDEIITRLSLDSVSSGLSDRSHVNSDEETGHELGEVGHHKRSHVHENDENNAANEFDSLSMPTPKATQRSSQLPGRKQTTTTSSSSLPESSHTRSHSSTSPPRFYVSHANETYVRTSQMEPSPAMQLPVFQNSTVGRSVGKRARANGGLVRTGSLTLGKNLSNTMDDGDLGSILDSLRINGSR